MSQRSFLDRAFKRSGKEPRGVRACAKRILVHRAAWEALGYSNFRYQLRSMRLPAIEDLIKCTHLIVDNRTESQRAHTLTHRHPRIARQLNGNCQTNILKYEWKRVPPSWTNLLPTR